MQEIKQHMQQHYNNVINRKKWTESRLCQWWHRHTCCMSVWY